MSLHHIVAQSTTPEWYAARRTGIGASQAGAACNISRYGGQLKVYDELVNGPSEDLSDNIHVRFGKFMEPAIVAMYADQVGKEIGKDIIYPMPMMRHATYPFMLATPDACENGKIGLEIKTIDTRYAYESEVIELGLEATFPEYILQCQQQMFVMGWDVAKVIMLIGKKLHEFITERDSELIEMIIENEKYIWECAQAKTPPEPTRAIDLDVFKKRRSIVGNVIALGNDAAAKWAEYESLGKQATKIGHQRDLLKAEVLHQIGDAPAGLLPDGLQMIRRKITVRSGFTVEPTSFLDVRKVKYDGSPIAQPTTQPTAAAS